MLQSISSSTPATLAVSPVLVQLVQQTLTTRSAPARPAARPQRLSRAVLA